MTKAQTIISMIANQCAFEASKISPDAAHGAWKKLAECSAFDCKRAKQIRSAEKHLQDVRYYALRAASFL